VGIVKELDFDELDRAVNSLMSNAPKTPDAAMEPEEKVVDISSSTTPTSPPAPSVAHTGTPPPASPVPPAPSSSPLSTSLPSRRGGRFMDVVHPSSDMKKSEPARPSRQGITIAPRPTFDAAKTAAPTSTEKATDGEEKEKLIQATSAPVPEALIEDHVSAQSDWPDPLDVAGYQHDHDTSSENAAPDAKTPEAHESPSLLTQKPADVPLTSPFLPDAKVEKRPLGGADLPEVSEPEEPDRISVGNAGMSKTKDDPNDQLPALPKDVEPVLPEELHSDLVEVESDTTTSGIPKTEGMTPTGLPPEPPIVDEKPVSTGPTSIPQQYQEEPTSGDKDSGAIYDTNTYHQPLAHPGKKKSGWLWVVWIVIILLIGAGAGAALYFFGII
jgi:hypothetical protein